MSLKDQEVSHVHSTMHRRHFLKGLTAAAGASSLLPLLDACGSTGSASTTSSAPVKLRFSMLNDPGEIKNAKALGHAFTKLHPNVSFSYEPVSGTYDQKMIVEAAGNTLPDIFWSGDVYNAELASKGVPLNLDPYLQQDGTKLNDIYTSMLDLGKYNGHIYIVPRDYNQVVTYYNKDAFTKAGLAMPALDWTYDDFLAACDALVKKGGVQYALSFIIWWPIYVPFVRGFGGDMLSSDGKTATFADPNAITGLTALTDLVSKGYAVNPAKAPTTDPFTTGEAAMTWMVRPAISSYTAAIGSNFTFDVTRFPKLPQKPLIGGGMSGYSVSSQTPNKDIAAKFVAFIASTAGQKVFEATGNSVPVLKSLQDDPTWFDLPRAGFNNKAYFYDSQDVTLTPQIPVSAQSTYDSAITDAFTSVYLGKASLTDAFKHAAQQVNNAIQSA